jgi:hypothetical protein
LITVDKKVPVAPDRVFGVLADGWLYSGWVVGASHIRDVDAHWPKLGARIHHSIGPWPLLMKDSTLVVAIEQDRLLELQARMWPFGVARVRVTLARTADGGTQIQMDEKLVQGPASLLPEPVQAALLKPRNRESLDRLAAMARGRAKIGQ